MTHARLTLVPALAASLLLAFPAAGWAAGDACPAVSPEALSSARLLDLTHTLDSRTPYWPGEGYHPFSTRVIATLEKDKVFSRMYETPEHLGTHVDAPNHFYAAGIPLDRIDPRALFGPAVVFDFTARAAEDADSLFGLKDLEAWEARHGRVPAGAIALLRTGWAARAGDETAYQNRDEAGKLHFPAFSVEAVRRLIDEREVSAIGIDTLSIDPGTSADFPVHVLLGKRDRYAIENLPDLGELPARGAMLIVAPAKIAGGSGGQARIFAILP